ncbi:hypothetical protein SAMN05660226_01831 [Parapedobacter luteus]|uniref:Uncharacterized protein n=1 Tax=Parapedobacter luteus TaxID=623280 RepID=A0A1T5BWN9_9SPHI|nr:hypothetical protein SAMN05660226_01831 [Parapedobacter luteus]
MQHPLGGAPYIRQQAFPQSGGRLYRLHPHRGLPYWRQSTAGAVFLSAINCKARRSSLSVPSTNSKNGFSRQEQVQYPNARPRPGRARASARVCTHRKFSGGCRRFCIFLPRQRKKHVMHVRNTGRMRVFVDAADTPRAYPKRSLLRRCLLIFLTTSFRF